MSRIDRIRLKVERAKEHIADLDDAIRRFGESEPYEISTKEKTAIEQTAFYVAKINPVPDHISLILGDAVHNLRSALDHLAWQLVEAGGGVPDRDTMFPIYQTPKRYAAVLKGGKIKGAHPGAVKLISAMQPYPTRDQTLWEINRLDIVDKHQLIVTVTLLYKGWKVDTLASGHVLEFPQEAPYSLVAGDELFNLPTSTYKRENHKNFKFSVDVAFGESEIVAGKPTLETVKKMADFVDGLVTQFEVFLV
jgi:hypothetical protein